MTSSAMVERPIWRRILPDLLGMAWVTAAAIAVFVPALAHGASLGPLNFLSTYGLSYQPGAVVHNSLDSDQITQMIPWSALAWTQVHAGHLPLWNPYSALGTPLAFNWQSTAFSLPTVVSYLFPLRIAYTVQVLATVVVAGCGAYVFGRVLRLGVIASSFAGVVFALSGPFFGWVGWPIASVFAWSGWVFAALLLVTRGKRRARHISFLAIVLALAVYAGQPDTLVLLGIVALVFVVVLLAVRSRRLGGDGLSLQPVLDTGLAVLTGAALSAPLLLPGAQLIAGSVRSQGGGLLNGEGAVPMNDLLNAFVGFDGVPIAWVSAVGAIAVVLAVTAIVLRRREPEIIALVVVGVVSTLLATSSLVITFMTKLPLLHAVRWPRALTCLGFVVAMLAGVGMDRLVHMSLSRSQRRWVSGMLATVLAAIVLLAIAGPGLPNIPVALQSPLPGHYRARTFLWEGIEAAVGLLVLLALMAWAHGQHAESSDTSRRRRIGLVAGLVLLLCQSAFLIAAGDFAWSSGSKLPSPTPAEVALEHAVGPDLVGLGEGACFQPPGLGILPNVNVMFGIHQMAVYDPLLQKSYFTSWEAATGQSGGEPQISTFCPTITSATTARHFGISYVLTAQSSPGPSGAIFLQTLGKGRSAEHLYKIPGATKATLTLALPGRAARSAANAIATPVHVESPTPSTWNMTTDATAPTVLRLHLAAAHGWHATIDGKPLALSTYSGIMLQARIPAGRHSIVVSYWPETFTLGIALAAITLIGLVAAVAVEERRRRPVTADRSPPPG